MMLQPGARPVPNSPDYILIRKLGAGAFGEVWHAHGPGGLDVALKFVRLESHLLAFELRSLEAMKSIRHPNLVSLFGAWHKDSWLILAMELCDRSLQDRLREALDQSLPGIPQPELLSYMNDAANGLDALNAKHVQHRDVKPANLLLLASGVKIADFGLAKAMEYTIASNSGAGTLAYTAPECFRGKLTQQSDQYSLAVSYYHLRTGQLLFKGNQAQVTYAHLELEPNLSDFLPYEADVLARALSKEPGKRWPSCRAFVNELIKAQEAVHNPHFIAAIGKSTMAKQYDEAIKHWNELIRLYPNPTFCSLVFRNRGNDWLAQEKYDNAIQDFDEAIRLQPKLAQGYYDRGRAWLAKGDLDKAIADFNEAIRIDPDYVDAHIMRADLFNYHKKDFNQAIMGYGELIRLDREGASTYHEKRGALWLLKSDFDKAINDFDDAIRLEPENAHAYHMRGCAWNHKREYAKAVADYGEAIRLDPKRASHYWSFARLLATCPEEKVRNGKRAVQMATWACELADIVTTEDLAILAAACAEVGQFDKAVWYQMNVLEHPDYKGRAGDHFRQRLELYKQKKPFRETP